MTDLDWELLAALDEADPVAAGLIIAELAEFKYDYHCKNAYDRVWWEWHTDGRTPRMTEELRPDEPFVGEFPWK